MTGVKVVSMIKLAALFSGVKIAIGASEPRLEEGNGLRTAEFNSILGCEDAYFPLQPLGVFADKSMTECGIKCLNNQECLSFNHLKDEIQSQDGENHTITLCFVFKTTARSCKDLELNSKWKYLSLTSIKGNDERSVPFEDEPTSTEPPPSMCSYKQVCNNVLQCSKWDYIYGKFTGAEQGNKDCFLRAVREGASVRVMLKLESSIYVSLTPITYVFQDVDHSEIIFRFAPRYQNDEKYNTNGLYKEYIAVSTEGYYTSAIYSVSHKLEALRSKINLEAKFYIRYSNCNAGGSPTFYKDAEKNSGPPAPEDTSYDLTQANKDGAVLTVHVKRGEIIETVPDLWTIFDPDSQTLGVVQYGSPVFKSFPSMEVGNPLHNEYKIVTTDGNTRAMEEQSLDGSIRTWEYKLSQAWYTDSCWRPAYIFFNNMEDIVYNMAYFISQLQTGARIRCQYVKNGSYNTRKVRTVTCSEDTCSLFYDIYPGLDATEPFRFESESATSTHLYFALQTPRGIMYSFDTNSLKTRVTKYPEMIWYMDSLSYNIKFKAQLGTVVQDNLSDVIKNGANLQLTVLSNNTTSYHDIEEVVAIATNEYVQFQLHTAHIPDGYQHFIDCGTDKYVLTKLVLFNNPFSLRQYAWSLDFQRECVVDKLYDHSTVMVLASEAWIDAS